MCRSFLFFVIIATLTTAAAYAQDKPAGEGNCHDQLRTTFEAWARAYKQRDLQGTMEIFTKDVIFAFHGSPDQHWSDLQATYRRSFAGPPETASEWVPHFEEVVCSGELGFVRSTWEQVLTSGGTARRQRRVVARNRGIDVFKRDPAGNWRIFRSLNYPQQPVAHRQRGQHAQTFIDESLQRAGDLRCHPRFN